MHASPTYTVSVVVALQIMIPTHRVVWGHLSDDADVHFSSIHITVLYAGLEARKSINTKLNDFMATTNKIAMHDKHMSHRNKFMVAQQTTVIITMSRRCLPVANVLRNTNSQKKNSLQVSRSKTTSRGRHPVERHSRWSQW